MVRKSNIELLRIVSMFLIILHHFSIYIDRSLKVGVYPLKLSIQVMSIGGKVGANCFFIIMAYFLIEKTPRFKKIIPLWYKTIMYSVVIFLILLVFDRVTLNYLVILKSVAPVVFNTYWFITLYIILYIFSPFLNYLFKGLSKKEYQQFLIISFVMLSVITMVVGFFKINIMTNNYILWGVFLYATGAYLKLYPIKSTLTLKRSIFLVGTITLIDIMTIILLDILSKNFSFFIGKELLLANRSQSTFSYLIAVSLFLVFYKLNIKSSTVINSCAATMITVYLIHDNFLVRPVLWGFVSKFESTSAFGMLGLGLISSLIILLVCVLIDIIMSKLLKKIQLIRVSRHKMRS